MSGRGQNFVSDQRIENFGHRNRGPPSIVGVHELNFCVRDGERWERRQWRIQRPERVAAVGKKRACFARRSFCRVPQQETGGPTGSHIGRS